MDEERIANGKRLVGELMKYVDKIYATYGLAVKAGIVSGVEVRNINNFMVGMLALIELKEYYDEIEFAEALVKIAAAIFMSGKMGE